MIQDKTAPQSLDEIQAQLDDIKARRASRAQRDVRDAEYMRGAAERDRQWTLEQWREWRKTLDAQIRREEAAERASAIADQRYARALLEVRALLGLESSATMDEIWRTFDELVSHPKRSSRETIEKVSEALERLTRLRSPD